MIKDIIKGFFTLKAFRRFIWITAESFIALLITYVGGIELWWAIPFVGVLQWLSKEISALIKSLK